MKKFLISAIILGVSGLAYAGDVANNSNYGAQYLRTANQNATTGSDAAANNQAGTVKMKDGFTIGLSNQTWLKSDTLTMGGTDYKADDPVPALPNLSLTFKQDKFAGFFFLGFPAGGGSKDFADGHPFFAGATKSAFKGYKAYYGFTLGGAYAINDMISVALAPRYILAKNNWTGSATYPLPTGGTMDVGFDVDINGAGFGGIASLNIVPMKGLLIAIRYETLTKVELETKVNKDTTAMFTDGEKERDDVPPVTGVGISYMITPELRTEVDFTMYHNTVAGQLKKPVADADFENGWEAGIAFEYAISPTLKASLGYLYSINGHTEETLNMVDWGLDSNTIAGGVQLALMPNIDLSLGVIYVMYSSMKQKDQSIEYAQTKSGFGIGVDYRI